MAESEKRKVTCSVCKQEGHTKRTCSKKEPEPTYEKVTVTQLPESETRYIVFESGICGFHEFMPRVVDICATPQDVVNCVNEHLSKYCEVVGTTDDVPTITLEKVQQCIDKKKVLVKLISMISPPDDVETKDSMTTYTLKLQVFTKPIRAHASAES
jgi:hypothetical protein